MKIRERNKPEIFELIRSVSPPRVSPTRTASSLCLVAVAVICAAFAVAMRLVFRENRHFCRPWAKTHHQFIRMATPLLTPDAVWLKSWKRTQSCTKPVLFNIHWLTVLLFLYIALCRLDHLQSGRRRLVPETWKSGVNSCDFSWPVGKFSTWKRSPIRDT